MRKSITVILAVLVLGFLSGKASALEFGHSEPYDENCIFGYFYFPELSFIADNTLLPNLKVEQNQGYWQYSWLRGERLELFTRVGVFEFRIKDAFTFTDEIKDFKAGINYYGSIGLKGIFLELGKVGFGGFAMLTIYEDCTEQMKGKVMGVNTKGEVAEVLTPTYANFTGIWNAKYGITMQAKVYGATVYGGGFAVVAKLRGAADKGVFNLTGEAAANYEAKNSSGVFIGVKIPLDENLFVSVEAEKKDKLAFGIALNVKFE